MSERNEVPEIQPDLLGPDFTEPYKLAVDTSKQLTTLNAGSIVIIGTFLKDIFPAKHGTLVVGPFLKVLIASSFVCFGVSLVAATFVMVYLSRLLTKTRVAEWEARQAALEHRPLSERTVEGKTYRTGSGVPWVDRIAYRFFKLTIFASRHATQVPLPFFTTGVLCFGLAVVLNLYR